MEWVKALHVISVMAWMAGLLYLPRLFVYHAESKNGSGKSETFKVMERRLYRAIMMPAMFASWGFGLWLVFGFGLVDVSEGWVWAKGLFVLVLSAFHLKLGQDLGRFARDENIRSSRYFRFVNEVPTVLMIGIVIMVMVKPFA